MPGDEFFQRIVTLLNERMDRIEKTQERMADAIDRVSVASERVAVLLAKHEETSDAIGRAFDDIEADRSECHARHKDHEDRLRSVESEMPVLKLTKQWVIGFTGACLLAVLSAVLALLF